MGSFYFTFISLNITTNKKTNKIMNEKDHTLLIIDINLHFIVI
jgi:hypothetical protein